MLKKAAVGQPGPSAQPQRVAMDAIIQGSIVDLFQTCGVALAPQPRGRSNFATLVIPEVTAAVSFTLTTQEVPRPVPGRLTLSIPEAVFEIMNAQSSRRPPLSDWIRELTNQLAARIKHRFLQFRVAMVVGLPGLIAREAMENQRTRFPTQRVYLGRTLRGEVLVTLDAPIDESKLTYSGAVEVGSEGDVILF
jgi:hypothetical protein